MIQDLARWAESEQFEDGSELKGIISQAHSFIFPASKEDSLPTCLHLCADQTPSQSCSDILSMSADSPSTVGTEGHQTMSLPPNERSGDPSCVEHLKSSPLLLTANVSLKPCTGSLPCEQGDALITDCKVVQSSSAKCHPTASSEKNVIQHLPSDMLQQQVTSSPPPAGATQASKRGLDDLVRRLELRQLGEENGSSCLPSPAKKPHIGDTELADSSDVAYFVPATAQDGASGEIIYIMAV
ncbi:hypothetical protein BaRGS_00022783 [Batillaria attramentaria]|uniref:Uncharacterized protein n=1 Tax=Batillaria attramentaria TaxID=370345 RepID=A0ABD0KGA8_9CAEN